MGRGASINKQKNKPVAQIVYTPEQFIPFLRELVEASRQTMRQISLGAGLDHAAVQRYLNGSKPSRDACISLAEYFEVPPNEMLTKAGYPALAYFDPSLDNPEALAPEVQEVAQELMKIKEAAIRRRVCGAVLQLVKEMFTQISETGATQTDS